MRGNAPRWRLKVQESLHITEGSEDHCADGRHQKEEINISNLPLILWRKCVCAQGPGCYEDHGTVAVLRGSTARGQQWGVYFRTPTSSFGDASAALGPVGKVHFLGKLVHNSSPKL